MVTQLPFSAQSEEQSQEQMLSDSTGNNPSFPNSPSTAVYDPERDSAPLIGAELERLREILYGSQARSLEHRLSQLKGQLETIQQALTDTFNERISTLETHVTNNVRQVQQNFGTQIEEHASEQSASLRSTHQSFTSQLDKQNLDRLTELRALQRDLNERLDKHTTDFFGQLRALQNQLDERLENLNTTHNEHWRTLQAESRQRNEHLRQELLSLAAALEHHKISRHELGRMLQEVGQRLSLTYKA